MAPRGDVVPSPSTRTVGALLEPPPRIPPMSTAAQPTDNRMNVGTVRLKIDQAERLRLLAVRHNRTFAGELRQAVDYYLAAVARQENGRVR